MVAKQYRLLSFLFILFIYARAGNTVIQEIEDNLVVEQLDLLLTNSVNSSYKNIAKKKWTFLTYMSADNDLAHFARKNLTQQADIGSTEFVNIVTQLDTRLAGNNKITKRYYIEKNKLLVMNQNDPFSQKMDSGDPETLISFCKWGIENFPAEHYALIFWNHGSGIIDLGKPRAINPSELFSFNPVNNLIELDRTVPFLDFINSLVIDDRGVCFDDSTGHYLTNQKMEYALKTICNECLGGKKFGLIGFDACLMSMVEIAAILKNYSEVMVGSQEVELGTGWRYDLVLSPFLTTSLTPFEFGKHVVLSYEQTYNKITNDYTQSAFNLSQIANLEQNINIVGSLLIESIKKQKNSSVRDAIKTSRHKLLCTHFDEPSYIDLHDLWNNLLNNIDRCHFNNEQEGAILKQHLRKYLQEGLSIITQSIVIANTVGKNLNRARGISIYFPERRIHNSYMRTEFAKSKWTEFLAHYLML